MEEIVRRLRNRKNMNALRESLPVQGLREADEDEEDTMPDEDLADEIPEEDIDIPTDDADIDVPEDTGDVPEEEGEVDIEPEEEEDTTPKKSAENPNPLDNIYAVKYKLGQRVAFSYSDGTNTKLSGYIEGYDKEGFYRVKWDDGKITNGITDTALLDIVDTVEEAKCVCGSTKFVNESHKLVCDRCGRYIKESNIPLPVAEKRKKNIIRAEAHPMSTAIAEDSKSSIKNSIRNAFKKTQKIEENYEDEDSVFDKLINSLGGEFWTRLPEMQRDIEKLGYEVYDINAEYVVVYGEDEEGEGQEIQIPIGGTSRTMFLDFKRARK